MPVYRFMTRDRLAALLAGELWFTDFTIWRLLESAEGAGIGDREEGISSTIVNEEFREVTNEDSARLKTVGMSISPGARNIRFENVVSVVRPRFFGTCFSHGSPMELWPTMAKRYGYDAAVEVDSIDALVRAIYNDGKLEDGTFIRDEFRVYGGDVRYESALRDFKLHGAAQPNPFRKPDLPIFTEQREARIVLQPKTLFPDLSYFRVMVPGLDAHVHAVAPNNAWLADLGKGSIAKAPPPTYDEAEHEMRDVLNAYWNIYSEFEKEIRNSDNTYSNPKFDELYQKAKSSASLEVVDHMQSFIKAWMVVRTKLPMIELDDNISFGDIYWIMRAGKNLFDPRLQNF